MNCMIVGIVCLVIGGFCGVFTISLCMMSKSIEEQEERNCNGCFGASFGDCDRCPKNKEDDTGKEQNNMIRVEQ